MNKITVTTVNRNLTVVGGFGSRELVTEFRNGRNPLWSRRPRGWVIQSQNAADLIAMAEDRGYIVVLEDASDAA